jgi:hypothetical protein
VLPLLSPGSTSSLSRMRSLAGRWCSFVTKWSCCDKGISSGHNTVRSDVTASQVQQAMVELGSTGACGISPAIRVALSFTQVIHFFKSDPAVWLVFIIQGAYGSQIGPPLISVEDAVSHILKGLNSQPAPPDPPLKTRERNIIIRARYAAGVSQADLARQFSISYQRIHQIVHGKRK